MRVGNLNYRAQNTLIPSLIYQDVIRLTVCVCVCLYVCLAYFRRLCSRYLVVCFLLDNSPASGFYMPAFRNTLFHLHRQV